MPNCKMLSCMPPHNADYVVKEKWKGKSKNEGKNGIAARLLVGTLLNGGVAFEESRTENIEILYDNIKGLQG